MQKAQQGFTLIELMIVVAIIGILASVALPAYQGYTIRAQVTEGLSLAAEAKTAIADFRAMRGAWPADNAAAGLAAANQFTGEYTASVGVANNVITVTYGNNANAKITAAGANTIILTGTETGAGGVSWDCTGGTVDGDYRPSACRP